MNLGLMSNNEFSKMDYILLMQAAEMGNTNVLYFLGESFQYGRNGAPINYSEAIKYYIKSMEQGDARAYFQLGNMYRNGMGVEKDIAIAVQNWEIARENGIVEASESLGYVYLTGEGIEKNIEVAIKYLQEASDNNMQFASYLLAKTYLTGKDILQDIKTGVDYLKKCERLGAFQPSDYLLGQMYLTGVIEENQEILEKNSVKAIKYLERAEAYTLLGNVYSNNEIIPRNMIKAIKYYKKAIEKEDYEASYFLASIHLCNDFKYMSWRNVEEGIYWAKVSLECSALPDMNICSMGLMMNYYDSLLSEDGNDETAEYVIKGYEYLFSQRQCLEKISEDKQGEGEELLFKIVSMLLGYYCDIDIDLFYELQGELEKYENKTIRFSNLIKFLRGYGYNCLGEKFMQENMFKKAKQCFKISLGLGYENAAENLAKFKKHYWESLLCGHEKVCE